MDILNWLASLIINIISGAGYWGIIFFMTLESACLPIPSEIIMPFSGYLVFLGRFNFWLVVLVGALGNLIGSFIAYFLGFFEFRKILEKYGKYILISKKDLDRADKWFAKYGPEAAFFSRLLPVVRTFISLPAGIARMNIKKFVCYTFAGSFLWSLFLTYVGFKLGENWQVIQTYFHKFNIVIVIIIALGIFWFIRKHLK
ncbi:MAG: DedA family protein [Patescibacteria group bacterium]